MRQATFIDTLNTRAAEDPSTLVYRFLDSGDVEGTATELSYGRLLRRARAIAATLQDRGLVGKRVLLLYPPGLDFIESFFGCLVGGVVAVPIPLPQFQEFDRAMRRLRQVIADAEIGAVLASRELIDGLDAVAHQIPELATVVWLATDEVAEDIVDGWRDVSITAESVAFLQYTSGSTSNPRGVMVTHGNLLHNEQAIAALLDHTPERVASWDGPMIVSWLPVYHDMGLIGPVLSTVYTGGSAVLMSPLHFLQKPERWLRAISAFGAHTSVAPNFGYELCVRRATPTLIEALDLSRWTVAFNGAEPIRPSTLRRFTDTFRPAGFRPETFVPGYGLAEATLVVSACAVNSAPTVLARRLPGEERKSEWVSCGRPATGMNVRIVDPETFVECGEGEVGEIWVAGGSVAAGYFQDSDGTGDVFGAKLLGESARHLRTGDLGFMQDDELYVTGRRKDLLIIDGKNHYPQDIELTVEEAHPTIRAGCVAAFAVSDAERGERAVVVAEVKPSEPGQIEQIKRAVRGAVGTEHSVALKDVVLLPPRTVFKTSSGKIQRQACKAAYLAGTLKEVEPPVPPPDPLDERTPSSAETRASNDAIRSWLVARIATEIGLDEARVAVDQPVSEFGLGSRALVELVAGLSEHIGSELQPSLIFDHPTIEQLAEALGGNDERRAPLETIAPSGAIAIVSMGCRLPGGADDPEALWQLLVDGIDVIGEPPGRGWKTASLLDPDPDAVGKAYSLRGGFLSSIDEFDAAFFGIGAAEATAMDPQQRLLLQTAWETIERAGLDPHVLRGSMTGVYVGMYDSGYASAGDLDQLTGYVGTGAAGSVGSGRIAYALDLRGPALTLDTACSSSLVAVHVGCQALCSGDCDLALAGGVSIMVTPRAHVEFSRLGGLSPTGQCRPFSAGADGVVWAEGCGLLLLKRLEDAERDGDTVLALIRGSAVNQDGRSQGLTAPNGTAQEAVLSSALRAAGVEPSDLDYVEAHGTGTPLGDPIEARALARVFGAGRPSGQPLVIGSLKSNIGHTQAAAGVAGVIKTVLAMQHEMLPASLHAEEPTTQLDWGRSGLAVQHTRQPWRYAGRVRRAGVSAFGMSGTNAHVVLEEAPVRVVGTEPEGSARLFPVSARSQAALGRQAGKLAQALEQDPDISLPAVARTLSLHRSHFDWRAVVVGTDKSELLAGLRAITENRPSAEVVGATTPRLSSGKVAFVFPGQGSQWPGMARELLGTSPDFTEELSRCDAAIRRYTGWSVTAVLRGEPGAPELVADDVVQPVLFAVMVSLAALWKANGIEPQAVVGHSQGEVAAAYVAGALSLADAVAVVVVRSRSLATDVGAGRMAVVGLPARELEGRLAPHDGSVVVAAKNSDRSTVLSGDDRSLEWLLQDLEREEVFVRRLAVNYASHSPDIEPLQAKIVAGLSGITAVPGRVAWYSTVLAERLPAQPLGPDYWWRNIREPVEFAATVAGMITDGYRYFIELSPHPSLTSAIETIAEDLDRDVVVTGSLRRGDPAREWLDRAVAELHVGGLSIDWSRFAPATDRRAELPTYAWDLQSYWTDFQQTQRGVNRGLKATEHPILTGLLPRADGGGTVLLGELSLAAHPWLADHTISDAVLLPATSFIDLALHAARESDCNTLQEFVIEAPLVVPEDGVVSIQVTVGGRDSAGDRRVTIHSRLVAENSHDWTLHAVGYLGTANGVQDAPALGDAAWPPGGATEIPLDDLYATLAERGYHYGPSFRGLRSAWRYGDDVLAEVELPEQLEAGAASYALHPALLDSALHAVALAPSEDGTGALRLPFAWTGVSVRTTGASTLRVHIDTRSNEGARLTVWDPTGRVVGGVESLVLREATPAQLASASSRAQDSLFGLDWIEVEPPSGDAGAPVSVLRLVDSSPSPGSPAEIIAELERVLEEVQVWLLSARADSRLVVVTRGGAATETGQLATDLAHGAIWGMLRCAQAEHPDQLILVDVDDEQIEAAVATAAACNEPQLVIRGGKPYAPRLARMRPSAAARAHFDKSGTVLITGATGSLGRLVARHLVTRHGVRQLLLTSRRGPEAGGAEQLVRDLTELGADVSLVACDLADERAVATMLDMVSPEWPLRAVVHCAGALADSSFTATTKEHLASAFHAKCHGAWHLHKLTQSLSLSTFVLFSSIAGVAGSPGQASYAAANGFLDSLAQQRQNAGLPAVSLAWGLWEQDGGMTGVLGDRDLDRLRRGGMRPLAAAEGLTLFDVATAQARALIVPARIAPEHLMDSELLPPIMQDLRETPGRPEPTSSFASRLEGLTELEQDHVIVATILDGIRDILGDRGGGDIQPDLSFKDLGLDSLDAVELRNRLRTLTGVRLSVTAALDYPTSAALASYLRGQLASSDSGAAGRSEISLMTLA